MTILDIDAKNRTKCNVVIKINKDNIKKFIDNQNNEDIEYTYANKNEIHKWVDEKVEHEIDAHKKKEKDNIKIPNIKDLIKSLIFANLDNNLTFILQI